MAKNRVIGINNSIPWHIPEEMAHFKKTTMGHAVIMGRKTHESIAGPLPGRLNIVLSRKNTFQASGCIVANSLNEAVACCREHEKAFIIGGRDLYEKAMSRVDTILLSIIAKNYKGDVFFPNIPSKEFQQISSTKLGTAEQFTLVTFHRNLQKKPRTSQ